MVKNNTGVHDVIQSQQWSLAGFLVIKVHQLEGHGWHYINKAGEYTILPSINEFIKNEKPTATQITESLFLTSVFSLVG